MLVIKGRIVEFIIDRNSEDGYAEFIFKSDYDKDCPRFEAICAGKIPDVVTGVPIKAEFPVQTVEEIKKINLQQFVLTKESKKEYKNRIAYVCINYNDEEYARTLLIKIKGISTKTANSIIEAVDGELSRLSSLWDDKAFWKNLKGSKRYYDELKDTIGSMMEKDILVKKYSRYGIGYPQVDILNTLYKSEAEYQLCKNPYSVMYRLELDFQVADNLAKDLGFSYLSDERIRAIVYRVLNDNEQNGNTAMHTKSFYMRCARLHELSAWKDFVVSPYYILAVISEMKSVYYSDGIIGYIKTMEMEADIAFQLERLISADTKLNTDEDVFQSMSSRYNKEQMEFLREFDKNSVTILLGRGGTGKTHSICGAIDLFKKKYPDATIKLCAPTARAAGVLREHSGYDSSTIHIALELSPYAEEADRNENNPIDAKLIVVDEMSMVDTKLMYHLVKAIQSGTKVILAGDVDQLESVGCGAVLRDLIDSNEIPKVLLKQIMRQNEGSAIIANCGKILEGMDDFVTNENFCIRYCKTEEEAKAYLKSCYNGDTENSQILSTTKNGIIGTGAINAEFEDTDKEGIWLHGSHFKVGDKVIFTRNNYDSEYCNGDIGFIESISLPVKVRKNTDTKTIEIDKDDAMDMEHADIITVHKSQGGEYKYVYILLPDKPRSLLTRNMVNTAISRAREKVVLIIVADALKISASNIMKSERLTTLKEKIKNSKKQIQGDS